MSKLLKGVADEITAILAENERLKREAEYLHFAIIAAWLANGGKGLPTATLPNYKENKDVLRDCFHVAVGTGDISVDFSHDIHAFERVETVGQFHELLKKMSDVKIQN